MAARACIQKPVYTIYEVDRMNNAGEAEGGEEW